MIRMWRYWFLVILLVPASSSGQSPAERTVLDRLKDSLASSWDTAGILGLERQLIEVARVERDDPIHHLRLGLIALRLSAIEPSKPHLDDAIGEFEWAAELRQDWPWPWYGIGLAEASGRNRATGFAGGLFTMLGLDRDHLAGIAFAKAIQADASFTAGLTGFANVALDQRIDAPVMSALVALRVATVTIAGWDPQLLLARGRLERLAGFPDSALIQFRRASLLDRRPAMGWLEIARTLPLTRAMDGPSAPAVREATVRYYLAGAASNYPDIVALYRRDIEPIAGLSDLRVFDSLSGKARADWLAAWWRTKDDADLREPGARLAEHFRRWDVARREFRLSPFRRRYRYGVETFRSGESELDDRGVVYVRQGEPAARVIWPRSRRAVRFDPDPTRRSYGSESWRYDRPDGQLVLHFTAQSDPQDYRLVESPLDMDVAIDQLALHAAEIPGLERLLRAGSASADWVGHDVRSRVERSMAIATQTDSWQRSYRELLSGRVRWYVVGVRNGLPLVHIVYALDADKLRRVLEEGDTKSLPVHIRASFFDADGRAVASLDTLQVFGTPSPAASLVAARAEIPVPPGALQTRLGIELSPQVGVVYPVDSLIALNPDPPELQLSAVLVGRHGQSLAWQSTPTDTAWLDVAGVYSPNDTLTVYAEGYGVETGETVNVKVAVIRRRHGISKLLFGNSTAVSVAEQVFTTSRRMILNRELDLNGLESGEYTLNVEVTSGGKTVKRSRGLIVRDLEVGSGKREAGSEKREVRSEK